VPWVTKWGVRIVDGKKKSYSYRVWVEPPKTAASKPTNERDDLRAEQAAIRAAQLANIKKKAEALAAKNAKELARKRMWDALHRRANDIRGQISPPTQGNTTDPNRRLMNDPEERQYLRDKAAAEARVAAQNAADAARWKAYADYIAIQQRKAADRAALDAAKKNAGTKGSGKTIERLVKEARDRQKSSGGTDFDQAYVDELGQAYAAHVKKVRADYAKSVDKLLSYYTTDKHGKLVGYKSQAAYNNAQKILKDKNFKTLQGEYLRLDGDGGKNKGSIRTAFGPNYDAMGTAQRDYTTAVARNEYEAAKRDIQNQVRELLRHGEQEEASKLQKEWNKNGKLAYDYAMTEIDPTKTSVKYYQPGKDGPGSGMVAVYRTVEEEFQYRREQYVAEMKRQQAEWTRQEQARIISQRQYQREMNTPEARQQKVDYEELARVSKELGLDPTKGPKTREDMVKLVDEATKQWGAKYRDQILTPRTKELLAAGGRGAIYAQSQKDYKAYVAAMERTKTRYYSIFQSEAPGILENVLNLPLIKPTTQVLGGIGGLPGTLLRWESLAGGSLFAGSVTGYGDVGQNTSKIGGVVPSMSDAPDGAKRAMDAAEYKAREEAKKALNGKTPGPRFDIIVQTKRQQAYNDWLKTDDGKKWYDEEYVRQRQKSLAQDVAFQEGMKGDLWQKLDAISTYGFSISNNDALNLVASIALDPTNAIPLKATTWLARVEHALDATKTVTGLAGVKRLTLAASEWMKVTEPELRLEKTLKPYLKDLAKGVSPDTIREQILARLGGIADGPTRAKETEKIFRQFGIDPRSANGHQLMSLVEESLASKFAAAGLDYRDVARQASELEAKRLAAEAVKKAADSAAMKAADAAAAEAARVAKVAAEKGRGVKILDREAEALKLETRAARPVVTRVVPDVMQDTAHVSTTVGQTAPAIKTMITADPLRRAVSEGTSLTKRGDAARSAALLQNITNAQDVVIHHGVDFAPGQYTDAFLASDKAKRWIADLDAKLPNGKPNTEVIENARVGLYEAGRRSQAKRASVLEGLGTEVALKEGRIPWALSSGGQSWFVRGGRKSHHQYIATARDLATRGGAHSPVEELVVESERATFEGMKKRLLSLRARLEKGRITQEQFDLAAVEIREVGVERVSVDLAKDIQSGIGKTSIGASNDWLSPHGVLEDILNGISPLIPTGEVLYEDLMSVGHLNHYYETFSLLPGLMVGPGYQTALMKNILDPSWRAGLTRGDFTKLLRKSMFSGVKEVGPMEFRAAGAHLFALFHLTLLDGDLKLLEAYGKSIETLLYNDPTNIFGRMWKVMETRADLHWADSFLTSEDAFAEAVLLGNRRLHPNLSLAMIPYGPLARVLPTSHGYLNHLQGLATTLNPMLKASPPGWVDDSVTVALTAMSKAPKDVAAGVTKASQIIHYIASRYGDVTRRAHFSSITQDFSIEAAERVAGRTGFPIQDLKSRYIEMRRASARLEPNQHTEDMWSKSFDDMFDKPLDPWQKRRPFAEIHDSFEDMYWKNEITHDNPGLHTMKFFEKMQHPALQRGDDWVRFASSYFDHMVGAGAEAEARTVLKVVFETEIFRNASMAFEAATDLGHSVDATYGGVKRGAVMDFLIRADLLPDAKRAAAEGQARVQHSETLAETEVRDAAMRDEFLIQDVTQRAAMEAKESLEETTHMYDNADISQVTERAGHYLDVLTTVQKQADDLIAGGATAPKIRVDAAARTYRSILRKRGLEAANEFLRKLPPAQKAHTIVEVRRANAMHELTMAMNRIVRDTLNLDSIPTSVGKQMEEIVALFAESPAGRAWLNEWSERYFQDLYASRLIDYLKHEEWFNYVDAEARGVTIGRLMQTDPELRAARTGAGGSIEKKMAEGDTAGSQADNVAEGVARGGTVESGGAMKPEPPREPTPAELQGPRVTLAQRGLEILNAMSEQDWLVRELGKARRARDFAKDHAARQVAIERIRNTEKALKVIKVVKAGGKGSYVPPAAKATFQSRIRSVAGKQAAAIFNPKVISPYLTNGAAARVEQGRALYRLYRNSPVDEAIGNARVPGEVSQTYAHHGAAIEAAFDRPIRASFLRPYGFPEHLLDDLTMTDILTNLDEFEAALRNPQFNDMMNAMSVRMELELRRITGDSSYGIQRWLDDRLVQRGTHYDALKFEKDERIVEAAIVEAREGAHRQLSVDARQRAGTHGDNPLTELVETDIRAVVGKSKALKELGVDVHAYNEARKVLRTPMLKMRRGQAIVAEATKSATDGLYAAGKTVDSKDWDTLFREAYDKSFMEVRQRLSDEEAVKQLEFLAGGEMLGSAAKDILNEFEKRWGLDQTVKGFEPGAITPYQHRTLEEAVKTHLGITDLDNEAQIIEGLGRHGQRPPFESRAAMREWLTKYGFWSPRTAQAIEAGKKSWSIQDEAKYYTENWGFAPDWSNPALLEEGGTLNRMLHDEKFFGEMNRRWGLFNRNMEARLATGKYTREQRARLLVEGSESLGIKAKRDLPMERKYVIERYGSLVADTDGNLTAFPWLMHRDELKNYMSARSSKGVREIAEDMLQNAEELAVLDRAIEKHIGTHFDAAAMAGKTVTYEDFFLITANVVTDLLLDPVWLKRNRDALGKVIKGQAAIRRSLVFTQLGFLTTNVIDTTIKGPWTRFITRSFRNGPVSAKAGAMGLEHFGLEYGGQLLRDVPLHGTQRIKESDSLLRKLQGVTELPAQGAGMAEDFTKLRLAQGMYDGAYKKALAKVGDEKLADSIAREFVGKEVSRLWPTVGDGPIEKLFNSLSPFISYQFKNHVIFIGEMIGHPSLFNTFNHIGDTIEKWNRERWAEEHPNEVLPANLARLIELPWAPGVFIDLGQFSDAQRGLKPLYQAADGKMTVEEFAANFVRLVGPNDQNIVGGILNALHVPSHTEWMQERDKDGFPTGKWTEVEVPWEAPWGGTANALNSFWPVEIATQFVAAMDSKWNVVETTKLFYQTMFFGGLKTYDQGAGLNSYFFALKESNPAAADAWLLTADGKALQMWWADHAADTKDWYTPQEIKDILNPPKPDPNPWFHAQSEEYQDKVKQGFEDLKAIRAKWDIEIGRLTPGTEEYKQAKLRAATERYQYYAEHPWMYEYEAMSKSASEWAKQLDDWKVDDLVQSYFDIGEAPKREDFKTAVLWQQAVTLWKKQRAAFLTAFPQVAERLGRARDSVEAVWKDTEQHWFDVLDRIGTRSIAIEAAKQAKDFDLVDQLYLMNELDYQKLGEDEMVFYFDEKTDYAPLTEFDKERGRGAKLLTDPSGQPLLPRLKILPDFNKWRYDRMNLQEKADFERDQKYAQGMKGIIAKAKASGNFGATFVRELKKHPDLLNEYFRRNPGKREQWAATDEYIRQISKYGILAKQGKFAEAGRYFDNLPDWVKARYYAKHPEKRQRMQQNLQYMNFMEKWTNFYRHRDYSGGAAYFDKLPQWVKDRYYSKHPEGQFSGGSSPYSKAMGGWVKLLQEGKKDEAKAYFDALPQAFKDRYYAKHPDQKLKNDIKRVGQLGEYFAADDANRALYLQNNPEFAKWLKAQNNNEQTRRMMILAAYQGLPKDDQWLRRVFREKYPEIFSQEAKGEASLKKTYGFLAEHPDMLPGFEKWLKAVWASYAENMQHAGTPPKPVESDHSRTRQHGSDRYPGAHRGRSAAWVRLHSLS
jgi:hypothetical protein